MEKPSESVVPVLRLAVISRLLVLILIVFWRLLLDPYDTSASLNPPCLGDGSPDPMADDWRGNRGQRRMGRRVLRSHRRVRVRVRADLHFSAVAADLYGADLEIRTIGTIVIFFASRQIFIKCYKMLHSFIRCSSILLFAPLIPMIGYRAVLALSGYVLNNVAFVVAAVFLYRLSVVILKDSAAAGRACVLFCFNPASIFYSSVYSECLYALSSLGGLFYLFSGANSIAMLLLAISGAARSNGAINAGYFCFQAILQAYDAIMQKKKHRLAVQVVIVGVARSIFIFVPFILFQAYGYWNICQGGVSDELRPWCKARIPLLYSFLQSQYWGVGFLRYFQVKQLPNYLLASPVLSVAVCSIIRYASLLPRVFLSLRAEKLFTAVLYPVGGGQKSDSTSQANDRISLKTLGGDNMVRRRKKESQELGYENFQDPHYQEALQKLFQGYHSIMVLPFILHLGFMTSTAFFGMHVQVATRFLSASPPMYWFVSYLLERPGTTSSRIGYLIWIYFIGYILLGSLLFSNFYPFT